MLKQGKITFWVVGLLALTFVGCNSRQELAEVEGTLTMGGEPLGDVKVTFVPDPEFGNMGRKASGITDASGKFFLIYEDGSRAPGVPVGAVRVILKDMIAAESGRDEEPIPSRFHLDYTKLAVTPLKYEVSSGTRQAFAIDLPSESE
jgi:hypothetical protein